MINLLTHTSEDLNYQPEQLLDALRKCLKLKSDAALSLRLNVAPPVISKIRGHRMPVGPTLLLRMHEESEISIKDLRALMGDHRPHF